MAVWLDSSQGVNYYLQGHRSAPRKAPNSVFLLECGQMFPTCCSENLTRMFPEPNSKNLREEGGERDVGGRAMGGGKTRECECLQGPWKICVPKEEFWARELEWKPL